MVTWAMRRHPCQGKSLCPHCSPQRTGSMGWRSMTVPLYQTLLHSPASCPNGTGNSPENLFRGLLPCHQVVAPLKCCVRPWSVGRREGGQEKGIGDDISQQELGFLCGQCLRAALHTTKLSTSNYWVRLDYKRMSPIYRKTQHFEFHAVHFGIMHNIRILFINLLKEVFFDYSWFGWVKLQHLFSRRFKMWLSGSWASLSIGICRNAIVAERVRSVERFWASGNRTEEAGMVLPWTRPNVLCHSPFTLSPVTAHTQVSVNRVRGIAFMTAALSCQQKEKTILWNTAYPSKSPPLVPLLSSKIKWAA